jgi:hemolysin activation/secretion protein
VKQVLIIGIATGILATTVSGGVLAATPARDARQELDYLDNMRRQQAIQSEVDRERERASQQAAPVNETPSEAVKPAEAKFMISRITLLGDDHPSSKVTEILDAHRDTLMGATEIMALVRDLTNYYAENGFVTTVVVVQPGQLNTGELTLEVKWGTIEGMTVNGKKPGFRDQTRLFSAMPFLTGKRLNMSDIDQAVDNLVRGGGDDKIRIVAGEREGTSILDVTNTTQKMFSGSVGVNNNGRESDGWNQYFASVGMTNLLGLNDSLSAYYSQQDYDDTRNLQQIGSASFSMPLGYWTLDASWSGSHYENIVGGVFGDYLRARLKIRRRCDLTFGCGKKNIENGRQAWRPRQSDIRAT